MVLALIPNVDKILHNPTEKFDFSKPQTNPVELVQQLKETMIDCRGVGLSANQVGLPYSCFVFGSPSEPNTIMCMFNPKIVDVSENSIYMEEGCLSYPGLSFKVKRPEKIRVRFTNEKNETDTLTFDGIAARIIQHEMDHLDGIVFTKRGLKYHVDKAKNALNRINRLKKGKK